MLESLLVMKLKIYKDTSPLLRKKAQPVSFPLNEKDEKLLLQMLEYIKLSQDETYREQNPDVREAVGLAAPQVGVSKRMLAIYYQNEEHLEVEHTLVNPVIIENSLRKTYLVNGEGCLSVDDFHEGYVPRDYKVVIKAYDVLKKKEVLINARGYEAIVLQHEIDHLNGVLYYDRINKINPFLKIDNAVEIS